MSKISRIPEGLEPNTTFELVGILADDVVLRRPLDPESTLEPLYCKVKILAPPYGLFTVHCNGDVAGIISKTAVGTGLKIVGWLDSPRNCSRDLRMCAERIEILAPPRATRRAPQG